MSFRLRQRGKDNNYSLPGCAAPIRYSPSQSCLENNPNMQKALHAHIYLRAHIDPSSCKLPSFFKAGLITVSNAMQVATKVITSWSLHRRGRADATRFEPQNKSRPSNTALDPEFSNRKTVLPALMSRSSWFACPSCCEVAMFPPSRCRFTLTSHR